MTSCDDCKDHVLSLLDNEGKDIPKETQDHLESCERCSEELSLLQQAHAAVKESLTVLAPRDSYLTDERLENILDACTQTSQEHDHGGDKIITIHWRTKFKYMMEGAATVAAMMILTIGFMWGFAQTSVEQEPSGTQAAASSDTETQGVEGKDSASFRIINDFDISTKTHADSIDPSYFDMVLKGGSSDKMIPLSSQGIKVPVRKTTTLRQDDYWW